jgi:uncharacterized protein YdeI (YjbR/CyaY-like superfamily)
MSKGENETYYRQKFTPRGKRSTWSKRNRELVAALIASGEMQPPGQAEIDRAKADGRWDAAYDSPANIAVPDDFAAALRKNKRAREFFETLDRGNRFAILHRLQTAKKPETREKRMREFVKMLASGKTIL